MNDKLATWKIYCENSLKAEPEKYCIKWHRNFKETNPLEVTIMEYLNSKKRYANVNMINELENILLNDIPEEYAINLTYKNSFNGIESILQNPENFPKELVEDLDHALNQYYKHNPIFYWDW
jgi:hypothetical protein